MTLRDPPYPECVVCTVYGVVCTITLQCISPLIVHTFSRLVSKLLKGYRAPNSEVESKPSSLGRPDSSG